MVNRYFAAILLIPGLLFGQAASQQALLMAMSANGRQMMSYQWKQKVTVFRKGNPSEPFIEEMRFDASGQLNRVTLAKPPEKHMGPLRARKAAEVKESVQEVMALARRYANPRLLSEIIQKNAVWEAPGKLRIEARSVVLPTDEMTIVFNTATYLAVRMDVRTQHDGAPVVIAVDYDQLPGGPSMLSRMTVRIPKEDIVVNVESYDFVRLAGMMTP